MWFRRNKNKVFIKCDNEREMDCLWKKFKELEFFAKPDENGRHWSYVPERNYHFVSCNPIDLFEDDN